MMMQQNPQERATTLATTLAITPFFWGVAATTFWGCFS
jgi:hypothetical protein